MLAQIPSTAMFQKWAHTWKIECDAPWALLGRRLVMTCFASGLRRHLKQTVWQAFNFFRLTKIQIKSFSGIEKVVAESGAKLSQLLLNGVKPVSRLAF